VGPLTGYSDLLQSFWAAVFLSAYSEGMGRVRKCPVTGYLLVAFLPLVSRRRHLQYHGATPSTGRAACFFSTGAHTLGVAGALAVGILMVSPWSGCTPPWRRRRRSNL
jgi:uncharacterized membrane protein YjjB (DUF3815 family)